MAKHLRLMEELLQIPIVGIEDAIVVPAVLANEFELKIELLDFISNNPFFGLENDDPHSYIKRFYQITQTFKINQVPHDVVKLILFPFSLKGAAETWLENEPPCSITTWDNLVSKFLNRFYPHSKTRELRKEITNFNKFSSTPIVPPLETPPLFSPKPKKNLKTNPQQPSIPYPSRLQEENFQALENPTGCTDHFVYRTDIVDSLCDKFPIENNSLSGNLIPSSDSMVESLSPLLTPFRDSDSLLEETDTLLSHINDSFPEYEIFCFNIEENSSGSTTSHSDHSLPDYEAFCFDVNHIEEKSSGSTTSHSDLSLPEYESFHFDLLIDLLPPADRSDFYHEEFVDELAHIISPPEYDRFYFDIEPDPGELTILFEENISKDSTKELTSLELNDFPLLLSDCDSTFSEEFSKIDLLVLFPYGNKDKIFDPGIFIIKGVQYKRFHILPLDDFSNISFVSNSLLLIDPSEIETFISFPSGNEDKVFDPGILLNNGIFSFTRKSPNLLIDNFMIDKFSSPTTDIDIIDLVLERFADEPALLYSSSQGDDYDDLFDLKSNNDEWKKLLYVLTRTRLFLGVILVISEIATLLSSPFENEDKVFNPSIFILVRT
ncbi:reverse transcriptase domain-containing protein [Tanacetum coccineum]